MVKNVLSVWDAILPPIYLIFIFFIGHLVKVNYLKENPAYKYFLPGLFIKILGGLVFAFIYLFYYGGGDTIEYYISSLALSKMAFKSFSTFLSLFLGDMSYIHFSKFDISTGWPGYTSDPNSFAVVRLSCILQFLSFRSYIVSTIIISSISYMGLWKLFLLFSKFYPNLTDKFRLTILYTPSIIFWGSGILKDTYTLTAVCIATHYFYKGVIEKKGIFKSIVMLTLSSYLLILIKPYIFIALLPGVLLWVSYQKITNTQNWFVKVFFGPAILVMFMGFGYFLFNNLSSNLGKYSSIDSILQTAAVTQKDLKQEYYQGNTFDIGDFDPSFSGIMKKFPVALVAGLFRPFLWDVKNVVMLFAALENSVILWLTILVLYKTRFKLTALITKDPLLIFSLLFAIFFAFAVGISTSNFGAMVRYKIPAIPFYLSSLIVLIDKANAKKAEMPVLGEYLKPRKRAITT